MRRASRRTVHRRCGRRGEAEETLWRFGPFCLGGQGPVRRRRAAAPGDGLLVDPGTRPIDARAQGTPHAVVLVMLMIVLIVLLVLALGGGAWGHSRYGFAGWSPAGILVLVLLVMLLTGHLHA